MISVTGLTKVYAGRPVLGDITLHIERRTVTGIVGDAGSGRTTLLRLLAALIRPTRGSLEIAGIDAVAEPVRARRHVMLVGEDTLDPRLTVAEHLEFIAHCRQPSTLAAARRDNVKAVISRLRLPAGVPPRGLAQDERASVGIAAAFVSHVDIVLIDDLSPGQDDTAHRARVDALLDAASRGTTIVAASDRQEHLEPLCSRLFALRAGRLEERAN